MAIAVHRSLELKASVTLATLSLIIFMTDNDVASQ